MQKTNTNSIDSRSRHIEAHSAFSSYFVLSGIWFVLAIGYALLGLRNPKSNCLDVSLGTFLIGLLWVFWLRGFRLRIDSDQIEYRNGLYKSVAVPLKEITNVRNSWIEWKRLGRAVKIPRLIITYGAQASSIAINTKPFRKQDIRFVMSILASDNQ